MGGCRWASLEKIEMQDRYNRGKAVTRNAVTGNVAILTIASNNYLHFARTMLQSAKANHPHASCYCAVVDHDLSFAMALSCDFETLPIAELGLPTGDAFFFQYSIVELNTAVKPWAIEFLLSKGHEIVIYLDPDIYVYGRMDKVESVLFEDADIVLTPHLLSPVTDDKTPTELDIRRSGAYNLGFCAVRESLNTRKFLHWWQEKLKLDCVVDLNRGLFVDQGWIDLVPGMFEKVVLLRDPGYNVAYWNLAQRPVTRDAGGNYLAAESPLVFFHFSGLDIFAPDSVSKYQDRFVFSTLGIASDIFTSYAKTVVGNGAAIYAQLRYGFGYFLSGDRVPDEVRAMYRWSDKFRRQMGIKPFGSGAALTEPFTDLTIGEHAPTNVMAAFWYARPDLQSAFHLQTSQSLREFYRWFAVNATVADLVPASVMEHHREIVKSWKVSAGDEGCQKLYADGSEKAVHRVMALYAVILHRIADPAAFRSYAKMCNTRIGYLRAWSHIGFSQESRKMPGLTLRMIKALFGTA